MAGTIFISCGQYAAAERSLGQSICDLVKHVTSFEPYFAENQRTLDDLSKNIFGALDGCSGFIAVMHHRGNAATPHGTTIRGSVCENLCSFASRSADDEILVTTRIASG